MGKYKNDIVVQGSKNLKIAFIEELKALDYLKSNGDIDEPDTCLFVFGFNGSKTTSTVYSFYPDSSRKTYDRLYTLPKDWDEALRLVSEELEPKPKHLVPEIGMWVVTQPDLYKNSVYEYVEYHVPSTEVVCRITGKNSGNFPDWTVPNISVDGSSAILPVDVFRKATKNEIQTHLVNEVNKLMSLNTKTKFTAVRKLIPGEFDTAGIYDENGKMGGVFDYHPDTDTLLVRGNGVYILYEKGVFATPVEVLPKINNWEGRIEGNEVIYGCAVFTVNFFETLQKLSEDISVNRTIADITLSSGVIISMKEIEKINEVVKCKK